MGTRRRTPLPHPSPPHLTHSRHEQSYTTYTKARTISVRHRTQGRPDSPFREAQAALPHVSGPLASAHRDSRPSEAAGMDVDMRRGGRRGEVLLIWTIVPISILQPLNSSRPSLARLSPAPPCPHHPPSRPSLVKTHAQRIMHVHLELRWLGGYPTTHAAHGTSFISIPTGQSSRRILDSSA